MILGNPSDYGPEVVRQLEEAKAFILNQDRFLVVSHVNPDGDAIGSTLAVGHMLEQLGKSYIMMNEGAVPAKFSLLPGYADIRDYSAWGSQDKPEFQAVIAVDCADYERIGRVREWFPDAVPLLNIDHHPTNDAYGTANLIHPEAAATAQVLYDLTVTMALPWTKPFSTCIYTGLLTDTGGFRYSNTTPKVMQIASEMLRQGVNGNELADQLLEKLTFSHISILRKALSNLNFTSDKKIAWMSVSLDDIREAGADGGDMDGLVNYPRNVEGVEVGLLFKQSGNLLYKVSLRSAGLADVSAIAQRFGGGGHIRAAGCTVQGTLQEAVQQVLTEVERALG
ncbi:DHH family phosphoesterase [Gorillibacterium sp. sgz5001074]|uniref:DHH family phosphoesterase n=1 Tax=Gorillibacterium sp. sgz5001074 TaxID=3446695 RepID=UPI003F67C29E